MTDSSKRRSANEWQQIIQDQQTSGLNQTQYCSSHNISLPSFYSWKNKLKKSEAQKDTGWLELPTELPSSPLSQWDMELELPGGVVLRMRH